MPIEVTSVLRLAIIERLLRASGSADNRIGVREIGDEFHLGESADGLDPVLGENCEFAYCVYRSSRRCRAGVLIPTADALTPAFAPSAWFEEAPEDPAEIHNAIFSIAPNYQFHAGPCLFSDGEIRNDTIFFQ